MAEFSRIQWTDHTFNPWRGCTKVSQGCANCYAERGSKRNPKVLGIWGDEGTRVLAAPAQWHGPLKWNKIAEHDGARFRVFCASLADVFEDWTGHMTNHKDELLFCEPPFDNDPFTLNHARDRLWELIKNTAHLDWLILTKRPENITKMMPHGEWPNVWLGVTVEKQEYTVRLDMLQDAKEKIKVPVLFCSAEPLLGPLSLSGVLSKDSINWVIVGGESGSLGKVRSFVGAWAQRIIEECKIGGINCFVKQLGTSNNEVLPTTEDPKCGDTNRWPLRLRVREIPTGLSIEP
jgi:protein gp37